MMKTYINNFAKIMLLVLISAGVSIAQVAGGGQYNLEEASITNGGGRSTGGAYNLQAVQGLYNAGVKVSGGNYAQQGGFNTAPQYAPTAAGLDINGRVFFGENQGLKDALVTLTGGFFTTPIVVRTNQFGYFRFINIQAGHFYVVQVQHRQHTFEENSVTFMLLDEPGEIVFRTIQ